MKKLEQIQDKKLFSSYGGPGSLIETMHNGSLMILPYDQWPCFKEGRRGRPGEIDNREEVENPILLHLVQQGDKDKGYKGYNSVTKLLKVPTPKGLEDRVYSARRDDLSNTVSAKYFPEWFYCPKCRRMHRLSEWKTEWETKFMDDSYGKNPPACYHCSERRGRGFKRQHLEQIRFVMASLDTGRLEDIPFDRLWRKSINGKTWQLDANPITEELSYGSSRGGDGLESLYIKKGTETISLSLINDKYIIKDGGCFRMMIRTGSNLYYPSILSSIYIPKPTPQQINNVINDLQHGYTDQQVMDRYKLSLRQVNDIKKRIATDAEPDARIEEFNYVTNYQIYDATSNVRREKYFTAIRYPNLHYHSIRGIYALTRIKETSVIMNYARVSPVEEKWWDLSMGSENAIKPKVVPPFDNNNPSFMPAFESYGEGLLFELDLQAKTGGGNPFTIMHTLCHLIMKELEFVCGYPVSSLKERLYYDPSKNITGFLIYTIQGGEGSYGGLISLMPGDSNSDGSGSRIVQLIEQAVARSLDCPNDPICSNESGHCFACLDLPEISCECWNDGLDRKQFIKYWNALDTR